METMSNSYAALVEEKTVNGSGAFGGGIMERLRERFLQTAQFEAQASEYLFLMQSKAYGCQYTVLSADPDNEALPDCFSSRREDDNENVEFSLRCVFQRSRPSHTSGKMDSLPFKNTSSLHAVFRHLELPSSYFQIADGSVATAMPYTFRDKDKQPQKFELVAHCLTKQGDWAMALTHNTVRRSTSVWLSVDERVHSDILTEDLETFKEYSLHPMLLPCIVLSATFRMAVQRRLSIKAKVRKLEKALTHVTGRSTIEHRLNYNLKHENEDAQDMDHLFELLHSCKKDQASRKGRYDFWNSFHVAILKGLQYSEEIMIAYQDDQFIEAHRELQHWVALVWQRLQSLHERDKDHVNQVDNLSNVLYNLVQQRDMRLQSNIAKASQRDSEDMKFIAVLGSVFLPASLVATILNVPQFQFAEGGSLFGAYLAITLPFILVVVIGFALMGKAVDGLLENFQRLFNQGVSYMASLEYGCGGALFGTEYSEQRKSKYMDELIYQATVAQGSGSA